jgi:hypothetical protein
VAWEYLESDIYMCIANPNPNTDANPNPNTLTYAHTASNLDS